MQSEPLGSDPTRISLTQVVKIGAELRTRLEVVAWAEGRDATSLARLVLREAIGGREAILPNGTEPH